MLSDIHGNLAALEAVLAAGADRYDELWSLGDIVGYGPRPNECVAIVRERCAVSLAGNHDLAACGRVDPATFSSDAGRAIRWTREVISAETESYLATLDPAAERAPIGLYHGSPRDPIWEYVLDPETARQALAGRPHELVLVGHTHAALAARLLEGRLAGGRADAGTAFDLRAGRQTLLNPGSVGQPRDADSRAAWLTLHLDDAGRPERAIFERTRYEIARTQREIVEAGLPEHLADRLSFGM